MSIHAIYLIRNKVNGKGYIGSTSDYYRRRCAHLSRLRKNRHHSILLQRAYNKYGEEAFEFIILDRVPDLNSLIMREQKYFDLFKPAYNVSRTADRPPGMKGRKFTEDHKRKLSEAHKGNTYCLGHRHSEQSKEKMRLHHCNGSNLPRSLETKKKMSDRSKKWHASLTDEQRKDWRIKSFKGPAILKETFCVICGIKIIYHSSGKYIPKTCSPECLSENRRIILNKRRFKDPDMDRNASLSLWSKITNEERKILAIKIGAGQRQPLKKAECIICHSTIEYNSKGTIVPKTCSPECLSIRRRDLLKTRREDQPDMMSKISRNRWANMTEEKRKDFAKKISDAQRLPDKKTSCVICNEEIVYRSNGKNNIPKTCGPECAKKRRSQILKERHAKNQLKYKPEEED